MLEALKNKKLGRWLQGGPQDDVVLSSRSRLARNIAGYPFLTRAGKSQVARIEELVHKKILDAGFKPPLQYYRLDRIDPFDLRLMVERHLIARNHADSDLVRGIAFSEDESLSIMVNEEDHLRMQTIYGGMQLAEAADAVIKVDNILAEHLPYAFSADYGYLTACPTNVGTGMRTSVMVHLPAIMMSRDMDKLTRICEDMNLALRGLYGEGTHGAADIYQISNNVTLGITEQEITGHVETATKLIVDLERDIRDSLKTKHGKELDKRLGKTLELLHNIKSISSEEALNMLSLLRMGTRLGLINELTESKMDELLFMSLPAHLQTIARREADSVKRNEMRASYIRKNLKSLENKNEET